MKPELGTPKNQSTEHEASPLQAAFQRVTLVLRGPVSIVSWAPLLVLSAHLTAIQANTRELS